MEGAELYADLIEVDGIMSLNPHIYMYTLPDEDRSSRETYTCSHTDQWG